MSAAEPRHGGASLSEQVVRGICDAHLSGGAAGPEQHQLPAACCESLLLPMLQKRLCDTITKREKL